MQMAIDDAGIRPDEVDYINAHGTSTELNDLYETRAIKSVFEEHAHTVAVSSTKSMTGHLLGGAGGVEAVIAAMAIHTDMMPPTINYENPDPELRPGLRAQHGAQGYGQCTPCRTPSGSAAPTPPCCSKSTSLNRAIGTARSLRAQTRGGRPPRVCALFLTGFGRPRHPVRPRQVVIASVAKYNILV